MQMWGAVLVGGHIICCQRGTDPQIPLLAPMDRIFLIVACASIVLLTTAIGLASPPINYDSSTCSELMKTYLSGGMGSHPPAAKKAPGPLVGTLETRHSKNDGLSVG
jgi:hypothetical protein